MKYKLQTCATGREFKDEGWMLEDPQYDKPSLIRAVYSKKQIDFGADSEGLYRFDDWLPTVRRLSGSAAPVTYKSEGLAGKLGLDNLYITFSGYYPERGGMMTSCSFKETEAYSVCGRMNGYSADHVMVVASAGNTARSFAKVCSDNNIPLLLCVPKDNLDALWSKYPLNDCVKLATMESGADYYDAIHMSNIAINGSEMFYAEGGAKNVARRDGMGTTMLSAVETIGRIPDYYFQAVGSGTGAIAAWEANLRFIEDGRFGSHKAKLIVSQNAPFQLMYDSWKKDSRKLVEYDDDVARQDVEAIIAKVLSNRQPPYGIAGGLYDALLDSGGDMTAHTNEELRRAAAMFEALEGIDIHPAAAIAVASLIQEAPKIEKESIVMLNITGGGEERYRRENDLHLMKPVIEFKLGTDPKTIVKELESLFR